MGEHKRKPHKSPRRSKALATTLIVLAGISIVMAGVFLKQFQKDPMTQFEPERSKGPVEAPLQIIEFADFQCSHCAQGSKILKEYMTQYPGQIFLAMKYFSWHQPASVISAYYAECAARQGKFWEFQDALFETQDTWRMLTDVKPVFHQLARKVQLNIEELDTCAGRREVKRVVEKETALGRSQSIKSTPTYFINGEMIVGPVSLKGYLNRYLYKGAK